MCRSGDGKQFNINNTGGLFEFGAATFLKARNDKVSTNKNSEDACHNYQPDAFQAIVYPEGA